ncbi:MAG: ATP-binding protein [Candidatus Scalindua sp.]|nr:ATP-binding protein [Candidatus Scalindua sp.]MBT5305308.1 ATP-binding protein [Candidatus Scalindua sp.]MBT6049989.1 ATP-binding protein [Candidatus Scalindua sp.]MBT6561322.1 ATP-binding protein [Candidatus Scalindua sp.]MBT7211235.1 ATP-binding protein [Candidatus Scalindua sp.]
MKTINILSLTQAYSSLEEESYYNFLHHYGIDIKSYEVNDLSSLTNSLHSLTDRKNIFNEFYVSYKIPQIGKEFDLLRIGDDFIINVELKRTCTEEKAQKQLVRNKYYLSSIGKPVYNWTFISDTNQLYFLNSDNATQLVDFSHLSKSLENQTTSHIEDLNKIFNPSVYLVSPFNSTEKFIRDEYFLTHHQEEIKGQVINASQNTSQPCFISITGSAGTGKTLLIYDIVKNVLGAQKRALIIHCGYLNDGQNKLISQYNWEITSIRDYSRYNLSAYEMVIVDEAQRIRPNQLESIVEEIRSTNGKCIFSYDKLQTLSSREELRNIDNKINNINSIRTYKLTEKIRTNIEIASFIKSVFDGSRNIPQKNRGNIELNYFNNLDDAKEFLDSLNNQDWEVIRFTPSQYNNEHHEQYSSVENKTSHGIIGQEFDNVAVAIDEFFSYAPNGQLIYKGGAYYHPVKMLFQNITRTIKKLNVVIINNSELLNRCVSVLHS